MLAHSKVPQPRGGSSSTFEQPVKFKDVMIGLRQLPLLHELRIECSGPLNEDLVRRWLSLWYWQRCECSQSEDSRTCSDQIDSWCSLRPGSIDSGNICTAHQALYHTARLCEDDTVLIQTVAGGVGASCTDVDVKHPGRILVSLAPSERSALIREQHGI